MGGMCVLKFHSVQYVYDVYTTFNILYTYRVLVNDKSEMCTCIHKYQMHSKLSLHLRLET